jgi:hypothetical protein
MTQCIGRIAKVDGICHFRNGKNRFYLEYRCPKKVVPDTQLCTRCTDRGRDKIQSSGKFDHGLVTGPIPDYSHMYGGTYYEESARKWLISPENLAIAQEHQRIARQGLIPLVPEEEAEAKVEVKAEAKVEVIEEKVNTIVLAKPKIKPVKRKPKNEIVLPTPMTIVASHLEEKEEVDLEDYEFEYVSLKPFEHQDISYFREPKKNKIFERKKDVIGPYIGRYDSYTDSIRIDIPDSDSE